MNLKSFQPAGRPKKTNEIKLIFNLFDWFCFRGAAQFMNFTSFWLMWAGGGYGRCSAMGSAKGSEHQQTKGREGMNEAERIKERAQQREGIDGMESIYWRNESNPQPLSASEEPSSPAARQAFQWNQWSRVHGASVVDGVERKRWAGGQRQLKSTIQR